ncbi:MAG TPA: inosine/xanthosine triphosphatase [Euryarchaeota archaeon]|nr:inosine/xanthosine triphosphatase [Euryarchaeota archaeon]
MKVGVGGTFNILHRGHRALLDKALEIGSGVVVGITSDRFALEGRERILPLEERMSELEAYLREKGGNWKISVIDDVAGGTAERTDIGALVVSPETRPRAEEINRQRVANGLAPLLLVQVPHVLAEDGTPISSSRILAGDMDLDGRMLRPIRVMVGSDNPVKLEAVRNVLSKLFSSLEVECTPIATSMPEQPFGEQTRQGAIERAKAALGEADFGIGLEAGVFETADGLYDVQYCAVVDKLGNVTVGHGSGFKYPPEVARKVREGWTVGRSFAELYGQEGAGRREGAIGFLTKGLLDRTSLSEQAVMAAMVPRIRWELYR